MIKSTATIYYGGFLDKAGGAFMHARAIESELLKNNWSVSVITLDKLPLWCRYFPHILEKLFNIFFKPLGFFYKGSITKILYRFFFNDKVDIRIFEDIYLSWNSEIPSVSILHAVWSDNLQSFSVSSILKNKLVKLEAASINNLNHPVVTVSIPYRKYLQDKHFSDYSLNQIHVIELGLDQEKFPRHNHPNRKPRSIVYSGVLEARKNVFFLLEVFKRLRVDNPEYTLTLIGDGPDKAGLMKFSRDNDLSVIFLGKLTHQDVLLELLKHEIYLHTSVKESFSYSLLEAKLSGLKTCAYDKLQVPDEFMDVKISTFDPDDWCTGVINVADLASDKFASSFYSSKRMTLATLNLVMPNVDLSI